jgi:hypothetical protein
MVPDTKTALALMQRYPEVKVTSENRRQPMKIGEIERVGEREIPMPNPTPQAPQEPVPSTPAPQRQREPRDPEKVP